MTDHTCVSKFTLCDSVRNFEWNINKEECGWGTHSR